MIEILEELVIDGKSRCENVRHDSFDSLSFSLSLISLEARMNRAILQPRFLID